MFTLIFSSLLPFFRPQPLRSNKRLNEGTEKFLLENTKAWQSVSTLLLYALCSCWSMREKNECAMRRKFNDGKPDGKKLLDASLPLGIKLLLFCRTFDSCYIFFFFSILILVRLLNVSNYVIL